jgi:trehalose 6-phosphate synthase
MGGENRLHFSDGSLVSALHSILHACGGSWVGWTGTDFDETLSQSLKGSAENYSLEPIFLTPEEKANYYRGFSNEIIWPLFHGLPWLCRFKAPYWTGYCQTNEKFAEAAERVSNGNEVVWVHDYHLMMLGRAMRARGFKHRLSYSHHIPFPPPDIFEILPWRMEILQALLHFDSIGFQTTRDRDNFIACLRSSLKGATFSSMDETVHVRAEGRCTTAGIYPISVDYEGLSAHASEPAVPLLTEAVRRKLGGNRVLLGIDRLDYTKGIPERLIAFDLLLKRNPDLHGRITMLQIVVPSREDMPEYRELKLRIETLVGRINGEHGTPGWVPIHYLYRSVSPTELIIFYRAADVAVVTPLKDGMNLVAKEFCASRVDLTGVLVLSEFAGAARELNCGALLVNPYDVELLVDTIQEALSLDAAEQRARMGAMRSQIRNNDVFRWARSFNVQRAPGPRRFGPGVTRERVVTVPASYLPISRPRRN